MAYSEYADWHVNGNIPLAAACVNTLFGLFSMRLSTLMGAGCACKQTHCTLSLFVPFTFSLMCQGWIRTIENVVYGGLYSASNKLIWTQPLNKRNTVAWPSATDATPSLAQAEYSPLIVWWVVAGWQWKKSALFSWLCGARMGFLWLAPINHSARGS